MSEVATTPTVRDAVRAPHATPDRVITEALQFMLWFFASNIRSPAERETARKLCIEALGAHITESDKRKRRRPR